VLEPSQEQERNSVQQLISTGLDPKQEDQLDDLLTEALFRLDFFMGTDILLESGNAALRSLFQTCLDSVHIKKSTIAEAGNGLFASCDIPKGTIIGFYPVHAIGCRFESGACQSVQLTRRTDEFTQINHETSAYSLYTLSDEPLCGVDLQVEFGNSKLFVDMNPDSVIPAGWFCGFINDGATLRYDGDEAYYPKSLSRQSVVIVPFGVAPFQVGITTRDVAQGEELFVSYGYSYWANYLQSDALQEKSESIQKQESEALQAITQAMLTVKKNYEEASTALSELFGGLGSERENDSNRRRGKKRQWLGRIFSKASRWLSR